MKDANPALRHGTYVVTYDVASRLQSFRSRKIMVPDQNDSLFGRFHQRLLEILQEALPNVAIIAIDMGELRRKVWAQVKSRLTDQRKQVVLSTCPEFTDSNPKSEGLLLDINRLFDARGNKIGHGPRPGSDHLSSQLDELTQKVAGRSVILIEDGAFTGGTLRYVLGELESRGVTVTTIIIGFCRNGSRETVKEALDGELVIVNPIANLVDWVPDHDLIPFLPNCGRVLGAPSGHSLGPVVTDTGISCAFPYILPFGRIEEWASIPSESAVSLSRFCIDTSIEIYSRVRRFSGHRITIGELLGSNPRISLPVAIGSHEALPALETEVVAFLRQMREKLE